MDMHNDWIMEEFDIPSNEFFTKEESIQSVKDNFNFRRYYTAEGKDIVINGVVEKCLVQTSSNPLRELNDYRKIHCPIDADVKRGYYVEYEDSVWIIDTNVVNVDGAYLSTRMSRCQYLLRWQDDNFNIIERWTYATDQTKYSNGETGNNNISVGDNQYALLIAIDEETKCLKREMRFPIDFDDANEPDVYKLTNRKVKLAEGTMLITLSFDALDKSKDKHITLEDGTQVWICDYHSPITPPSPPVESTDLSANVSGGTTIRCGRAKTWTAAFKDKYGNEVIDCDFHWNIVSDFTIHQVDDGNKIQLKVIDENSIGCSFLLQLIHDDNILSECEITVIEGF